MGTSSLCSRAGHGTIVAVRLPLLTNGPEQSNGERGITLVELIVAFTILAVLTTMAVPLARYQVKRQREKELRWSLDQMRHAIDQFKDMADRGELGAMKMGSDNYPESLEILVKGVRKSGTINTTVRFLRKIPKDPMTNSFDWGMHSTRDDPASTSWGGQNVFDVFTKSTDTARDGSKYSDW